MAREFFAFIGRLSTARVLLLGLFCAVIIEAITAALRFGLDLQVTRDTGTVGNVTFGLRIHHGYMGLLLLPIALLFRRPSVRKLLLIIAIGLILSDLFHHFLVLWPLTGSPHFDLFYPRTSAPLSPRGERGELFARLPTKSELLEALLRRRRPQRRL